MVWSGSPGEAPPAVLLQSLGSDFAVLSGPLTAAARAVQKGRQALFEMRCGESLAPLETAIEQLASDVPIATARPQLGELYGLLLSCADRVNDAARAERATAALRALEVPVPPDLALILQRQPPPVEGKEAVPLFGPPRAPVLLETDPPGAAVLRNYVYLGATPLTVAGGRPERDRLDIEAKGMRKLRRPLESGTRLVLALRPEERAAILAEAASFYKLGSDEQGEALAALAQARDLPAAATSLLLSVGPKQRSGTAVADEALLVRAYDLKQRKWVGATAEIAAGGAAAQAQALRELLGRTDTGAKAVPGAALAKSPPADPKKKSWLPFAKTKWYNWVIAGGVAALIAGLLISERVTPEKVTITATK